MTLGRARTATSRARRRAPRAVPAAAATLALGGPLVLAAVLGSGNSTGTLELSSGAAWVVSPEQGLVHLLDGASEQVAVSVRAPGAGHDLSVTQSGTDAYLVDQDAGTVARVDAARYEVGTPVGLGTAEGRLTVLRNDPTEPGADPVVYVVDATARTAAQVDPRTLAVRHEIALSAQPGPEQATVDDAGRLVVADSDGTLTLVDPGRTDDRGRPTKTQRRIPTVTATTRLVLVEGSPVLVDVAAGTVQALAADGAPRPARCLDTRASDDVEVLGSSTGPEVFAAVSDAGALLVSSTEEDSCSRTVPVAEPDAELGPLAQSGPYVFVPDRSTGETVVVDTREDEVLVRLALTEPGNRVELRSKDGLVFFNDLDSSKAGVLSLEGGEWSAAAVEKYDPETGEGTHVVEPDDAGLEAGSDEKGDTADGDQGATEVPREDAGPGDDTTPGRAPGAGPPSGAPQITTMSATPDPVVLGESATFAAAVTGAAGATWEWTLTDPGGGAVATSTRTDSFSHTLPAAGKAGAYRLRLTVTVRGLSATQTLPVTVGARPVAVEIVSLATDRSTYAPGDVVQVSAEVAAPDGATWTWGVAIDGTEVMPGEQRPAGDPFQYAVWPPGEHTFTLTVRSGGVETSRQVTVPVIENCQVSLAGPVTFTTAVRSVVVDVEAVGCTSGATIVTATPGWLRVTGTVVIPPVPANQTASMTAEILAEPPVDGLNEGVVTTTVNGRRGPSWDVTAPRGPRVVGAPRCSPGLIAVDLEDADSAGLTVTAVIVWQYRHVFAFPHDPPERTDPPFTRTERLTHAGGGTYSLSYPRSFTQGNDTTYVTATLQSGRAEDRDRLPTTFGPC